MEQTRWNKIEKIVLFFYFALYIVCGLTLVFTQPFGNPPDEYNRFLIPQYIATHSSLPNGFEESIRIPGYGFSYAFQPIFPYMIQGFVMRLVGFFTTSFPAMLYSARLVNFFFGLLMAGLVYLLSQKWFEQKSIQFLFCFLVTFLPQSLFLHTYVNTDSCCMLSITMMLYALTKGFRDDFSLTTCMLLAGGIILCALSYYNAYGFILTSILLFTAYFLTKSSGQIKFKWQPFLKKGLFISILVLLGIGWWFLRSALLYEGDFLGLKSRNDCALLYADPAYHPDTRITWQNQGHSLFQMLGKSDFINLSILSFIGIFGAMSVVTSIWVYRFYKALFFISLVLCVVLPSKKPSNFREHILKKRPALERFFHLNMIFCIFMPVALSITYSYSTDYQPQGRYLLPLLLPFAYYLARGLEKGLSFVPSKKGKTVTVTLLLLLIVASLLVTIFGYALPYYIKNPVAP